MKKCNHNYQYNERKDIYFCSKCLDTKRLDKEGKENSTLLKQAFCNHYYVREKKREFLSRSHYYDCVKCGSRRYFCSNDEPYKKIEADGMWTNFTFGNESYE